MTTLPILTTERLVLRLFREDDAPAVERMLATPHVAEHTLSFTHPLPPGAALEWIRRHLNWVERGTDLHWAITLPGDKLIGAIGLNLHDDEPHAHMGYWIGPDFWNRGYATEAARAVVSYGFEEVGLARIEAICFTDNLASARVLEKAGLVFEELREAVIQKDDHPRDVLVYGISATAWRAR